MNNPLEQTTPITNSRRRGQRGPASGKPRSLPIAEWPAGDRLGWVAACQPAERFKRGGAASHLAAVSQHDIANRYGLYLDFLRRNKRFDAAKSAMSLVNPDDVNAGFVPLRSGTRSISCVAPRN